MKAGKHTIKSFFVNRHLDELVIPEIQRDYVWQKDQVIGLIESLYNDFKEFKKAEIPIIETDDNELIESFKNYYKSNYFSTNIGFIYAYTDAQYQGKYYLIDGQQRITTVLLLMLSIASNEEDLSELFKQRYFNKGKLKLNYKVREATQTFLNHFVDFNLKKEDESVKNQYWYFDDYKNDKTINSLIDNYDFIEEYFNDKTIDESTFFDFLENQVDFWYFDTNLSKQGEELYIYMNARGEQVEENENIKANLLATFDDIKIKNKCGAEWEDWQDFFWKHKGKNENADNGFNEFLRWVAIIEMVNQGYKIDRNNENNISLNNLFSSTVKLSQYASFLDFNRIRVIFNTVKYLFEDFKIITFLDKYSIEVNTILKEEWLNKPLGNVDLYKLLPIIVYCLKSTSLENIDSNNLLRWLRFTSNSVKNDNITKSANVQCVNLINIINELDPCSDVLDLLNISGYDTIRNEEELLKLNILNKSNQRLELEELFWIAEDINVNNGSFSHLIEWTAIITNNPLSLEEINIISFKSLINSYKLIIQHEDDIWGDLVNTDVYYTSNSRLLYVSDWHLKSGIQDLTFDLFKNNSLSVIDVLERKRKKFLSQYTDVNDVINESNAKTQFYIYYLLLVEGVKTKWYWESCYNIGLLESYKGIDSFFDKKYIFQLYSSAWHDNPSRIIMSQKQKNIKQYLPQLLDWAKN